MSKPKVSKPPPIKKVIVSAGIANLTPDEKVTHAKATSATCLTSTAYTSSPPCQQAMMAWMTATDNLEKNQQSKQALLVQLGVLNEQETTCIFAYDEAAATFASTAKTVAAGDRAIVVGMGLGLRTDPVKTPDALTPTGLRITILKTTRVPRLEWDAAPGARLYVAQMSVAPATEVSWSVILGSGKTRLLGPLAPGQAYVFRVAALGKDGKQSAWTPTVSFTG